jgi:hypothetical protein
MRIIRALNWYRVIATGSPCARVFQRVLSLGVGCAIVGFGSGCGNLKATLALRPQIAIKVPGAETQIPEDRKLVTNGWTFVHLAAVQYETRVGRRVVEDAPAQWYLAVPSDPKKYGKLSWWSVRRQYSKARTRLPEIADATKLGFGVYPTTLEVVNVFDASKFAGRGTGHNESRTARHRSE